MTRFIALAVIATAITGPALAAPACTVEAGRKVAEAGALRYQARQEAIAGNRDRTCDALDEAGDRYGDARDTLDDCGFTVSAIELRTELRAVRHLRRYYGCENS